MALKRFYSLDDFLEFKRLCYQQLYEYIKIGHAKTVNEKETSKSLDIPTFLPYHGVFNINKPGKLRIVCLSKIQSCIVKSKFFTRFRLTE